MTSGEVMPGVVKKLEEVMVDRIAAGEVIQRPANALKDLLEMSLDAGSTQIRADRVRPQRKIFHIQDNRTVIIVHHQQVEIVL
jgi:DNA mismatch repair protein MLH1